MHYSEYTQEMNIYIYTHIYIYKILLSKKKPQDPGTKELCVHRYVDARFSSKRYNLRGTSLTCLS